MLEKLFQEIGIDGLTDPGIYAVSFNGTRVFHHIWDGMRDGNAHLKGQVSMDELQRIIKAIENLPEPWIDNEDWAKIKQIGSYIIHLKYPPTAKENYVEIYKTGPANIPWKDISAVWENRSPFIATKAGLKYGIGGPIQEIAFEFPRQLQELYRVFKRNAVGWFDGNGYQGSEYRPIEQLTLANSDVVTIYFDQGPVEIHYFRSN